MKNYCYVPTCRATEKKYPNISFHQFPKEGANLVKYETKLGIIEKIDRRKLWLLKLKLQKVAKTARICSLHFRPDDYLPTYANKTKRRFLKNIAVPSLNLPFENKNARSNNGRIQRLNARNANKEKNKQPIQVLNLQETKGKSSKKTISQNKNSTSNKQIKSPVHFDIPLPPLLYFGTGNINRVSSDIEIEENKSVISEKEEIKEILDPLTIIDPGNTSENFKFVNVTPKIENCYNADQSEIVLLNL